MSLFQKRVQRAGPCYSQTRNCVQARSPSSGAPLQTNEEGSWRPLPLLPRSRIIVAITKARNIATVVDLSDRNHTPCKAESRSTSGTGGDARVDAGLWRWRLRLGCMPVTIFGNALAHGSCVKNGSVITLPVFPFAVNGGSMITITFFTS